MYVLLKRAKKNVGDFLIGHRAQTILEQLKPGAEMQVLNAWEPLDDHLDLLNGAAAVIICGGPGIQARTYPVVYPLVSPLTRLRVPLVMLGSGWFGVPGDEQAVQDARFTPESTAFFDRVDGAGLLSVRDYLSQRVLNRAGYHNVILTGCPAWYHLPSLGKPLRIPSCLQRVVFTPPRKPLYASQSRQLMEGLRRWLPDATLHCSFHRGIGVDSFTSPEEADTNHRLHVLAQELGFEVHDVAYDLDRIAFYADCDLHVGYRVHAHLDFLSRRRPSVLLAEDSRGRGACEALGLRAFPAWERQPFAEYLNHIPGRVGHALRRRYGPLRADAHLADQVLAYLRQEVESGFRRFVGIPTLLDRAYEEAMRPFVARIPE